MNKKFGNKSWNSVGKYSIIMLQKGSQIKRPKLCGRMAVNVRINKIMWVLLFCFLFSFGAINVFAAPTSTPAPTKSPTPTTSSTQNKDILITPNFAKVLIDGETKDFKTFLIEDKVYVSVRDIAEGLGLTVGYNAKTATVELKGWSDLVKGSPSRVMMILYIVAKSLQLAGLALFTQVAFIRLKKDHYFVKKYTTSQTSLRRLSHTAGSARMGVYFTLIGTFITSFAKESGLSLFTEILIIVFLTVLFLFLGLGAANSTTRTANDVHVEMD